MVIKENLSELRDSLNTKGYCVIKNALSKDFISYLKISGKIINPYINPEPDKATEGNSVLEYKLKEKNSLGFYCPQFGDGLLAYFLPLYEKIIEKKLAPSFCFYRRYFKGNILTPHTDRPSCQYSITLFLDSSDDNIWDFYLTDKLGNDVKVEQNYGDLILYKGEEVPHWREPLTTNKSTEHIFLHWVDPYDPKYAPYILDKRKSLGLRKKYTG